MCPHSSRKEKSANATLTPKFLRSPDIIIGTPASAWVGSDWFIDETPEAVVGRFGSQHEQTLPGGEHVSASLVQRQPDGGGTGVAYAIGVNDDPDVCGQLGGEQRVHAAVRLMVQHVVHLGPVHCLRVRRGLP